MKAIILAAGRGSRMNKLTEEKPKCLLEVGGLTLLSRQKYALREAGITDIGIVTGYKRELLSDPTLTEFYNDRWHETNMVSSLEKASSWLSNYESVVSYSDIYYQSDAVKLLINSTAEITITYDLNWQEKWTKRFVNPLDDAESFLIDKSGKILEIGKKSTDVNSIQGQYMGLLKFTPRGWKILQNFRATLDPLKADKMHMTRTLQALIESGAVIKGIPYSGRWGEYDSPEDLNYE